MNVDSDLNEDVDIDGEIRLADFDDPVSNEENELHRVMLEGPPRKRARREHGEFD